MEPLSIVLVLGFVAACAFVVVGARRRERRQRALMLLCRAVGVEFSLLDPFPDTTFLPFWIFGWTRPHGVQNVVWNDRGEAIRVFDLWFEVIDEHGATVRHDLTCGVVPLPFGVPPIALLPRGMIDPVPEQVADRSLTLELDAFNRRFDVRAADPRAAVALLDQRMMQTLMHLPLSVAIHVREDRMLLAAPVLDPAEMLLLLEVAHALAERVPPVVASLYPPRPAEGPFEDRWRQGHWSPDPTSAEPQGLEG